MARSGDPEISHLTQMIEELATSDAEHTSITTATPVTLRTISSTPRASRFVSDSAYSTPQKEPDDPNWPTREVSYAGTPSYGDRGLPPRFPSVSPRKTASRIVSAKIDDHIYTRGFLEGACSDITLTAFDKDYMLHRIILDRSPFFSMMFAGPWRDSESNAMKLTFDDPNISRSAFEFSLSRIYGKFSGLEGMDCLSLLATAAYLDLADLQEQCTNWLLKFLNTSNLARVVNFVLGTSTYGISSERLKEACRALLFRDGYEMSLEEWDGIPVDLIEEIVSDDAFFCPSEVDRYNFVVGLMRHRADCSDETEVLESVLRENIYYMHMSHAEHQKIIEDGYIDESVIYKASYDSTDLEQLIRRATNPVLGASTEQETEHPVPCDDTCYIGDPLLSPPSSANPTGVPMYSKYPPFRFSAEFDRINDLKEDTRVYSHTVSYAGSLWNIYIHNKIRARKSRQLGVYLHRVEVKNPLTGAVEASSNDTLLYSPTRDVLSTTPPMVDAQGVLLGTSSEIKRSYADQRSTISTYFKIYCPSRKNTSKIGVTEFRSGPDEFHRSQSWGWKSRGLCAYDERESVESVDGGEIGGLKFMVVLGVV